MDVKIQQEWKDVLEEEFSKDYFKNLVEFLHKEKESGKVIYPPGSLIFNAFNLTPFSQVKVVILGQDPYHNPGQAHGLSFSVPEGVMAPPSLKNIYKEIENDVGISLQGKNGNLEGWAKQGVFLLNAILTVRAGVAASHSRIGWEKFTDAVIQTLSDRKTGLVFMLWGNFARSKKALIDSTKHTVLEAAHPSPLAGGAFFGCRHFSKCNNVLVSEGLSPIDWSK
ncbi:MAG: uracil-DNA glycosylase [Bacteroidales bacterium]|jgi:uracil-DNA glycosylase|nr:uracil-DNA glycosylase [Bacteroidales bacterium]MCI1733531.1 uracil-DNA glycosylase [Bacteroidales bacterium]